MRILILDDLHERHEGFRKILYQHTLTHVMCYSEAVAALKWNRYDMLCLDHDLGDIDMGDDGRFKTGCDVAAWLEKNPARCPAKVLVHSHNPVGVKNILDCLADLKKSGVEVVKRPYKAV
jgi:CheY-like chemotaxis protein